MQVLRQLITTFNLACLKKKRLQRYQLILIPLNGRLNPTYDQALNNLGNLIKVWRPCTVCYMYFIFDAHETFNNGEVVLQDMRILSFCGSEHFNKDSFQKWSSDEKQDHTKLIFVIVIIAKKTPWQIFASQINSIVGCNYRMILLGYKPCKKNAFPRFLNIRPFLFDQNEMRINR